MNLHVQNLTYHCYNRTLIESISFTFQTGHLYGLLGVNGAGKSTFLKILMRLWEPSQGQVFWNQSDLKNFSRLELSQIFSFIPQNPSISFDFSVLDIVNMARYAKKSSLIYSQSIVKQALEQVAIWHLKDQAMSQLSGGERQRVYIARALATEAPILLLDEPTSYLDLRYQLEVWSLLRELADRGKLVIAAMHDLWAAKQYCDELLILSKGQCKASGSYDTIINAETLEKHFSLNHTHYAQHRHLF